MSDKKIQWRLLVTIIAAGVLGFIVSQYIFENFFGGAMPWWRSATLAGLLVALLINYNKKRIFM